MYIEFDRGYKGLNHRKELEKAIPEYLKGELKPCPFCGAPTESRFSQLESFSREWQVFMSCSNELRDCPSSYCVRYLNLQPDEMLKLWNNPRDSKGYQKALESRNSSPEYLTEQEEREQYKILRKKYG